LFATPGRTTAHRGVQWAAGNWGRSCTTSASLCGQLSYTKPVAECGPPWVEGRTTGTERGAEFRARLADVGHPLTGPGRTTDVLVCGAHPAMVGARLSRDCCRRQPPSEPGSATTPFPTRLNAATVSSPRRTERAAHARPFAPVRSQGTQYGRHRGLHGLCGARYGSVPGPPWGFWA